MLHRWSIWILIWAPSSRSTNCLSVWLKFLSLQVYFGLNLGDNCAAVMTPMTLDAGSACRLDSWLHNG